MDGQVLYFPQGNDIVVTARFPEISDGTGATASFYCKDDRYVDDADPTTQVYTSGVNPDPDFTGATMSVFHIPAADIEITGAFWWRVDVTDVTDKTRTASCGTLLVEAV